MNRLTQHYSILFFLNFCLIKNSSVINWLQKSQNYNKRKRFSVHEFFMKKKKNYHLFPFKGDKTHFSDRWQCKCENVWEPEQQLRKQALSTIQSCQCFTLLLHFWFYTQIIEIENFRRTWEMFLSNCCWIKKLSISIYRQGPVITNNKNEIWVIVTGSTFLITPTLINY